MQRSFWSSWFKPAAGSRKWTLEELSELYEVLLRNGVVTEQNRAVVVETIRTIAEYILWGDQNEPRIFDFFLENNILTYLHKVLLQSSNRSGEVAKQVLQTLSIIIQNVRSETGIFFLFSNNHINNIVDLDFDFSDEEVLGYYISFLKTISLKLNTGTVHFFLNSSSTGRGFPLYSRALRLAHNREGMVRAAVRTLTLKVYSVPDPDIRAFVTSGPASHYFTEVAQYLAEQVQLLDRHLLAAEAGGAQALSALDSQLAETEDVISYVSDLLSLGVPGISQLLANSLWQCVVWPLLLLPLMQPGAAEQAVGAATSTCPSSPSSSNAAAALQRNSSRGAAGPSMAVGSPVRPGHFRHWSWGSGSWATAGGVIQQGGVRVRPACAVLVLERLFLLVSYPPLLHQLLLALTCPAAPAAAPAAAANTANSSSSHPLESSSSSGSSQPDAAPGAGSSSSSCSSSCRVCLLTLLKSSQPLMVLLVLRLFVAIVDSKHIAPELLSGLSLLPRKQQQLLQQQQQQVYRGSSSNANTATAGGSLEAVVQQLLQQLQTTPGAHAPAEAAAAAAAAPTAAAGGVGSIGDVLQGDLLLLLTEQYISQQQPGNTAAAAAGGADAADSSSDSGSSDDGCGCSSSRAGRCLQALDQWVTLQQQQQQQAAASTTSSSSAAAAAGGAGGRQTCSSSGGSATFSAFGQQLLSSLLQLLPLPSLPPLGLWLLGWLLHQLLPVSAVIGAAAGSGSPAAAAYTAAAANYTAATAAAGQQQQQHIPHASVGAQGDSSSLQDAGSSRGISRTSSLGGGSDEGGSSDVRHYQHRRSSTAGSQDFQQQLGSGFGDTASAAPHGYSTPRGPPLSTTRTISIQSSLGFQGEPRASVLSPEQQQLLQQALHAAHTAFAQQLSSMWCEAVFPLLAFEWPAAREMLLHPVLRASGNDLLAGTGAWPVLRHLQQQQQQQQGQQQQGGSGWGEGQSVSAQAALECYLSVQRVVALTQIQELLRVGCIASSPPVPTVSEADLKQVDIQEGYQVDLAPGSALPCVVSFAPGQERRVFFAVAGLSRQQLAALQAGPPTSPPQHTNSSSNGPLPGPYSSSSPGTAAAGAAAAAAAGGASAAAAAGSSPASLLRSLPVAVLADPSPSRPQAGVVLSVAPLLGARPYTDAGVNKWLHVHVRPSVRGLLRVIKTSPSKKGGLLSAMRQLADGHWVLAFSSGDKAALAVNLVQQHAGRLQRLYGDALAPLRCSLQPEQQQEQPQPQGLEQQQRRPPLETDQQQQPPQEIEQQQQVLAQQEQNNGQQQQPAAATAADGAQEAETQEGRAAVDGLVDGMSGVGLTR